MKLPEAAQKDFSPKRQRLAGLEGSGVGGSVEQPLMKVLPAPGAYHPHASGCVRVRSPVCACSKARLCSCENSDRAKLGISPDWAKLKNIVYVA